MRILHVVPTYWPAVRYGGPIVSLKAMAEAQAELGDSVTVLATSVDGSADLIEHEVGLQMINGVAVSYFRSRFARRFYYSQKLGVALQKQIPNVDIVHTHSVFLWPTWKAARCARAASIPLVISPRGMLVKALIERRNRMVKSAWIKLIERHNLNQAQVVVVSSTHERDALLDLNLVQRVQKIVVVPHGVLMPAIQQPRQPQPNSILYLGRISWEKGIDLLLHAMTKLPRASLRLAGEGDASEFKQLAIQLGIAHRVDWLGALPESDRDQLLAQSAVLVLASISENFGNVVVEAMARACPVVVTNGVGSKDCVQSSGGGLVCDSNAQSLAQSIDHILSNPVLALRMGEAGRRYAVTELPWSHVASRMRAIYADARQSSGLSYAD